METNNPTAQSDTDQPERASFCLSTLVVFMATTQSRDLNVRSSSFLPVQLFPSVHRPAVAMLKKKDHAVPKQSPDFCITELDQKQ